jgi:hypothetical protein
VKNKLDCFSAASLAIPWFRFVSKVNKQPLRGIHDRDKLCIVSVVLCSNSVHSILTSAVNIIKLFFSSLVTKMKGMPVFVFDKAFELSLILVRPGANR